MNAYLHSLSIAVPPHVMAQDFVERRAREMFGERYPQFERLARTFTSSGVERRYSVVEIDWFSAPHGWAERNDIYLTGALEMFVDAASRALAEAGWRADEVDCIVTVSSTGIATPTLEARAMGRMGFRRDVQRVPVFGLGCAGGVSGLTIARSQSLANPGAKVLLVVVEACSVAFRADRMQKADIIATVLFGDGAAAACLSSVAPAEGVVVALGQPSQRTWPDTLAIMGWDVDDTGLGVVFDRSIPDFALAELAGAVEAALLAGGLDRDGVEKFICHPGGAKVIEAIETALHLRQGELAEEREVLRDYGNMSAPTVLFVLKAVMEGAMRGQMMACALGPGFSASFMPLRIEGEAVAPSGASCGMSIGTAAFLGFLLLQRLAELVIAQRNTRRLLARGAREVGAAHYPLIVALHVLWLGALVGFGYDQAVQPFWLALFVLLQGLRVWILATLGPRWSTRIIVLDEPLVRRGPFRWLRHPNYTLVVAEIAVAPLVLGLVWVAVVFSLLNAAMLTLRIRVENAALAHLRRPA